MSVGLGLGDFCGVIAVCRESGGESVVADADGERYTPSVVSIGEGGVVVSLPACFGCFRYTTQCARHVVNRHHHSCELPYALGLVRLRMCKHT